MRRERPPSLPAEVTAPREGEGMGERVTRIKAARAAHRARFGEGVWVPEVAYTGDTILPLPPPAAGAAAAAAAAAAEPAPGLLAPPAAAAEAGGRSVDELIDELARMQEAGEADSEEFARCKDALAQTAAAAAAAAAAATAATTAPPPAPPAPPPLPPVPFDPCVWRARLLITEVTYIEDEPKERANAIRRGHIHLLDVAEAFSRDSRLFRNEAIVFVHFSAKYAAARIP